MPCRILDEPSRRLSYHRKECVDDRLPSSASCHAGQSQPKALIIPSALEGEKDLRSDPAFESIKVPSLFVVRDPHSIALGPVTLAGGGRENRFEELKLLGGERLRCPVRWDCGQICLPFLRFEATHR